MGDFLMGDAFGPLEEQMKFRIARQAASASNLANADTPGYRRIDLHFDAALDTATLKLQRSDGRHLPGRGEAGNYRIETGPKGTRPDGNGVNVDAEIILANRNAGAFIDMANVMNRIIKMRASALQVRR